jgi:hypothetical protein
LREYVFFGPLANARGHFRSIHLPSPFKIERWHHDKIVKQWRILAGLPKSEIEVAVESCEVVPRENLVGHVVVGRTEMADDTDDAFVKTHKALGSLEKPLEDVLRLIGLVCCAQVDMPVRYWWSYRDGKPQMELGMGKQSTIRELPATVSPASARDINAFTSRVRLPIKPDYIQLALDHWDESLSMHTKHLEFLSLMMALEALFNVGAQDIRYRVSRSVAVLLGQDEEASDHIFDAVKEAYDVRSKLVHTGSAVGVKKVWMWSLRHIVRDSIIRLQELNLPKDEVSRLLTRRGFGQGIPRDS